MCFSPEKHAALKRKFECSSPVKVNKYNLKKNNKTGEEELIWNKRTKIEEPQESEMEFDLQPIKAETVEVKDSSAEEILGEQIKTLVNIAGRVTLNGPTETVKVKGKTLKKQGRCSRTTLAQSALSYGNRTQQKCSPANVTA